MGIGLLRWRWRARGLALLRVVVGTWRLGVFELRGPSSSGCSTPTLASTPRMHVIAADGLAAQPKGEQYINGQKRLNKLSLPSSQAECQHRRRWCSDVTQKSRSSSA